MSSLYIYIKEIYIKINFVYCYCTLKIILFSSGFIANYQPIYLTIYFSCLNQNCFYFRSLNQRVCRILDNKDLLVLFTNLSRLKNETRKNVYYKDNLFFVINKLNIWAYNMALKSVLSYQNIPFVMYVYELLNKFEYWINLSYKFHMRKLYDIEFANWYNINIVIWSNKLQYKRMLKGINNTLIT